MSTELATTEEIPSDYPLAVRACFIGSLIWSCPKCGHISTSTLTRRTYRLRCGSYRCRKRYGFGVRILVLDAMQRLDVMPHDWETLPLATAANYVPRAGAHELASAP